MTGFLLILGFSVLVTLILQSTPRYALVFIASVRILWPTGANAVIYGSHWPATYVLHPSTVLIVMVGGDYLVSHRRRLIAALRSRPREYFLVTVFCLAYILATVLSDDKLGVAGLFNVVLAPAFYGLVVHAECLADRTVPTLLSKALIVLAIAQVPLILVQAARGGSIIWSGHLLNVYYRPLGTFDSPLDAAFLLAIAIPLAAAIKTASLRIPIALTLLAGIAVTESRLAAAVGLATGLWLALVHSKNFGEKALGVILVSAAGSYLIYSEVANGLLLRFSGQDGDSDKSRAIARSYLLQHVWDHPLLGTGWGATRALKNGVLPTSLENGFGTFAIEAGVLPVLAVLIALTVAAFRRMGRVARGYRWALLSAVVLGFGYSGLNTMAAAGFLLWTCFGLAQSCPSPGGTLSEAGAGRSVDGVRPEPARLVR